MQTPVARNLHILSSTRVTPRRPPSPAKASHAWPPSAGSNNSVGDGWCWQPRRKIRVLCRTHFSALGMATHTTYTHMHIHNAHTF